MFKIRTGKSKKWNRRRRAKRERILRKAEDLYRKAMENYIAAVAAYHFQANPLLEYIRSEGIHKRSNDRNKGL